MTAVAKPFFTLTNGIAVPSGAYTQDNVFRIPSVDPSVYYLNRGAAFYKFLMSLGSPTSYDQPRFEFINDDRFPTEATPDADYDAVVTTIAVDESGVVVPKSVIHNTTTGENILVTAVSGTTLTVIRGYQGTTAAVITAATDKFVLMTTVLPEGDDAGDGVAKIPNQDYNFISFFSETMANTDMQAVTNMLNETGKVSGQLADYIEKLTNQMDSTLRWSARNLDNTTYAGKPIYNTGGFSSTVDTNIGLVGALTWQDFNDEMNSMFDQTESSERKVLMCGATLYDKINTVAWDHYTAGDSVPQFQTVLGDRMQTIQLSSGGMVDLVRDPKGFATSANLAHKGFLIDPAYISLSQFSDWDMMMRDVTENKSHTLETELWGSCGLKIPRKEHHANVAWTLS
jgi:hypothetical protein